jgi:hypothetical protein
MIMTCTLEKSRLTGWRCAQNWGSDLQLTGERRSVPDCRLVGARVVAQGVLVLQGTRGG